jgi:hypothetical protein
MGVSLDILDDAQPAAKDGASGRDTENKRDR